MEAVKSFNQELSSLYEIKPPISKAKMTSITKGAIKAIKFYKHVVQSVEKFIQKCRSEYKIPGLYVIDSIVRQSRHQFGAEKDVFAPRFAKNVQSTFYHLYKCPEEEKSKVIRVLNLWQKNEVFPSEVIQPLFDLANPSSEIHKQIEDSLKRGAERAKQPTIQVAPETQIPQKQQHHGSDQQVIQQLQTIQQLLKNHVPATNQVKFNKKLLDFDYSDDEEGNEQNENQPPAAMLEALQGILGNERVLQQLKSMGAITTHQIQQLQQLIPQASQHMDVSSPPASGSASVPPPQYMGFSQEQMHASAYLPQYQQQPDMNNLFAIPAQPHPGGLFAPPQQPPPVVISHSPLEEGEHAETDEDIQIVEDRGSRSRDRSKRRRSRSRSRDRKKRRRSRSRSRERRRRSRERKEEEREGEREKRKEREKRGLPSIKKGALSVCSTTLWVGHLSKLVSEEDLSDLFGSFGDIESIHLVPPRGCAFVCMNRRMDASKALRSLHKHKLHGKNMTLAWAPGKGMKDKQWKDYWDVELGVSYIPIDRLDPQVDMAALEEGGMFDEETMPDWMKTMRGVAPQAVQQQQQQFIPVPEGVPPQQTIVAPAVTDPSHIPIPGAFPPIGLPPGLPPVMPPPGLGAGLLTGLPRFGLPPPTAQLTAPPPGFPGFDVSQPPPGLPLVPPKPFESQGGGGMENMNIDDGNEEQGGRGFNNRDRRRESRWGGGSSSENGSENSGDLASRLRNLAGMQEGPPQHGGPPRPPHGGPLRGGPPLGGPPHVGSPFGGPPIGGPPHGPGGPKSLLGMPDIPKPEGLSENAPGGPQDMDLSDQGGAPPPGFGHFNNEPPPPFGRFDGGQRGGFRGGRGGGPPFGRDGPPPFGEDGPPFRGRGGRGGWRGGRGRGRFGEPGPFDRRGGPPFDGPGGFDGPPGFGGPPFGGPPFDGPPHHPDNRPPWENGRGGRGGRGRGRGGRFGGPPHEGFGGPPHEGFGGPPHEGFGGPPEGFGGPREGFGGPPPEGFGGPPEGFGGPPPKFGTPPLIGTPPLVKEKKPRERKKRWGNWDEEKAEVEALEKKAAEANKDEGAPNDQAVQGQSEGTVDVSQEAPQESFAQETREAPQETVDQQESNDPPQGLSEAPQESFEAPQESFEAPQESFEPPQESHQPAEESFEPPQEAAGHSQESHEAQQETSEPLQESYETPQESYEPPQESYEPPQESHQPSQESSEAPHESAPQETFDAPEEQSAPEPRPDEVNDTAPEGATEGD